MSIIQKEQELSDYMRKWTASRYPDWKLICDGEARSRHMGIYHLKDGSQLMDLLYSITGYMEAHLLTDDNEALIPSKFSSIEEFLLSIDLNCKYYESHIPLMNKNRNEDFTPDVIVEISQMVYSIQQMKERCWNIYHDGLVPTPYQQAHLFLNKGDVDSFLNIVGNIIKEVPYDVRKEKMSEAYFHTLFHVITSVLGFDLLSEKETIDGRIDVLIKTPCITYIFELST